MENYRLYGNPDGRQAMEVSIGLPNFLKGPGGWVFVALWMVLLAGVLPYFMYSMYLSGKDRDRSSGLHNATIGWLVSRLRDWPEGTRLELMPEIIGGCADFAVELPVLKDDISTLDALTAAAREDRTLPSGISPTSPDGRNRPFIDAQFTHRNMLMIMQHGAAGRFSNIPLTAGLTKAKLSMYVFFFFSNES
jgi:hypothetical protein